MIEEQFKTIDGVEFSYMPLMATPARKLLIELMNRLGPVLGGAVGGAGDNVQLTMESDLMDGQALTGALSKGITQLATAIDPDFYEKLVEQLGKQSKIKTAEGGYITLDKSTRDLRFAVQLALEFRWVLFCLEAQYSDFFGLARQTVKGIVAARVTAKV